MSFLSQPIGLSRLFPNNRLISDIKVDVIINESTNDVLTITKQPVQQGASITDHAYKEPTTLSMSISFRDGGFESTSLGGITGGGSNTLRQIYQKLLTLQDTRVPFVVNTPKRIYNDMLISAIGLTTDRNTENVLAIQISFQQVIIVQLSVVVVPRTKQKNAGATGATQNTGKKQSGLVSVDQGLGGAISKFFSGIFS